MADGKMLMNHSVRAKAEYFEIFYLNNINFFFNFITQSINRSKKDCKN